MSRLDVSLDRLLRPGLGLLVLDEYADAAAARRRIPASALAALADAALRSPLSGRRLSGAIFSESHLNSMPPSVDYVRVAPPFAGLRVAVDTGTASANATIEVARHQGADLVELRANRRPGQFPRRESHVAVVPLAAAAASAQELDLVPVLSTSMPGMDGTTIGVTRAVTVNALSALFRATADHDVDPARVILRTNLVAPGPHAQAAVSSDEVARLTLDALEEALPAEVPAVWFMSSGRSLPSICRDLEALTRLAAARGQHRHFGYAIGRALLEPALDGMVSGGLARAHQRLGAACDALYRALRPALVDG